MTEESLDLIKKGFGQSTEFIVPVFVIAPMLLEKRSPMKTFTKYRLAASGFDQLTLIHGGI